MNTKKGEKTKGDISFNRIPVGLTGIPGLIIRILGSIQSTETSDFPAIEGGK
jgi:hypothetical protein